MAILISKMAGTCTALAIVFMMNSAVSAQWYKPKNYDPFNKNSGFRKTAKNINLGRNPLVRPNNDNSGFHHVDTKENQYAAEQRRRAERQRQLERQRQIEAERRRQRERQNQIAAQRRRQEELRRIQQQQIQAQSYFSNQIDPRGGRIIQSQISGGRLISRRVVGQATAQRFTDGLVYWTAPGLPPVMAR